MNNCLRIYSGLLLDAHALSSLEYFKKPAFLLTQITSACWGKIARLRNEFINERDLSLKSILERTIRAAVEQHLFDLQSSLDQDLKNLQHRLVCPEANIEGGEEGVNNQ